MKKELQIIKNKVEYLKEYHDSLISGTKIAETEKGILRHEISILERISDEIRKQCKSAYYTDEDTITLYISNNELLLNAEEIEEFLKVNKPINSYDSEGVASFSFKGKDITIDFLIEIEDVLDERLIFCSRYLGSVETIKSLGLD